LEWTWLYLNADFQGVPCIRVAYCSIIIWLAVFKCLVPQRLPPYADESIWGLGNAFKYVLHPFVIDPMWVHMHTVLWSFPAKREPRVLLHCALFLIISFGLFILNSFILFLSNHTKIPPHPC
jgi:hypothetical protein